MNCPVCGTVLAPALIEMNLFVHPNCEDQLGQEMERRNEELKSQLLEIIHWADSNSDRSQQLAIGPSEIGLDCDQRVARILAGMPQTNGRFDPWAGIVGTSIHAWLRTAVDNYLAEHVADAFHRDGIQWLTETRVHPNEFISGSSDLYTGDVVDYKSAASDKIKLMRNKGREAIQPQYLVQGHIYGLGNVRAGRPVRDIVLVFVPRNGLIKDMYIYREPYDENIAFAAIDRLYRLVDELTAAGLPDNGDWDAIKRNPSQDCWYCSFYVERSAEEGPDAVGCPGNSKTGEERREREIKKFTEGLM
jgi:hypothetical protein